MYGGGLGAGSLTPVVPITAGIAVLPNTGGNHLLMVLSIVSIVVGSVILMTTLIRYAAKLRYKA